MITHQINHIIYNVLAWGCGGLVRLARGGGALGGRGWVEGVRLGRPQLPHFWSGANTPIHHPSCGASRLAASQFWGRAWSPNGRGAHYLFTTGFDSVIFDRWPGLQLSCLWRRAGECIYLAMIRRGNVFAANESMTEGGPAQPPTQPAVLRSGAVDCCPRRCHCCQRILPAPLLAATPFGV